MTPGPWGIRDWVPLIRVARRAGFDYRKICDHVWAFRSPHWRVVIDGRADAGQCVEVTVHRRTGPGQDFHSLTLYPTCVGEVENVLGLLGVLPAVECAA